MKTKHLSFAIGLGLAIGSSNVLGTQGLAADPTIIYRGESTAVQFDVSPPLAELAKRTPTVASTGNPNPDRPTGLEGPLGPQDRDALVQRIQGSASPGEDLEIPGPSVGFDAFANGSFPPDPNGDVGPNHYVVMANVVYAVYDKTGTLLAGPSNINTLWSGFGGACENENAGDPIVVYDQLADRWILTQFTAAGPTYFNCVAISQTPDPTSTYYRYAFSTGTNFPDYPKYGVWPDAYYISTREFAGGFAGIGAYAVNRAQMIAGNPAPQVISFLITPGGTPYRTGDGLLPTDFDGTILPPAGSPNFFIGSQDNGGPYGAPSDALNIYEFHVDFATPGNSSFTGPTVLPVSAFDSIFPCSPGSRDCIPQPDIAQKIDHQGYRQRPIWRAAYRNFGTHESIVTNQSVEASPSVSGVRWWEIRSPGSSPTVYQEGTYAPAGGLNRWMGSIAQDRQGNMALGYSVSSASVYPGIRYTGRLAGNALGTMPQGEGTFFNGSGSQTSLGRWGDYTAMTVDPTDDCTFWYVNEYLKATGTTKTLGVGAFKYPTCTDPFVTVFNGGLDNASPTMLGRLNRNGVQSTCAGNKTYPGELNPGTTYNYSTRAYTYTGPAACVTFKKTATCDVNAHLSVYDGAFDPANKGMNYLGDIGGSANSRYMGVSLATGQNIVVVMNGVNGVQNCDFDVAADTGLLAIARNDFLADFGGAGLWQRLNDTAWQKIHNASPALIGPGDLDGGSQDEAITSFGGAGLWARYNNTTWVKLHNATPKRYVAGDLDGTGEADLVVDFGPAGIWVKRNNAGWAKLHNGTTQDLAIGNLDGNAKGELIADFGGAGLWVRYNDSTWMKRHIASPKHIVTGDLDGNGLEELIADFGASGLWARYNDATWMKLHNGTSQGLATGDLDGNNQEELIADFGAAGLWARYNDATWVKRHAASPNRMLATDLDVNGMSELIVDFGAAGLWVRYNNTTWMKIHNGSPQDIAAGGFD